MTLPDERYRAVIHAKQFLQELLSTQLTPRVPKNIRDRARSILRHFPSNFDMELAAEKAPDVFSTRSIFGSSKLASSKTWSVQVQEDPETDEMILQLPEEALRILDWSIGDKLQWIDNKDGSWSLQKV